MDHRSLNRRVTGAGAVLICVAVLANLVRIAAGERIASIADVYVIHQPSLLVELLVALFLAVLVVTGAWTPRRMAAMAASGVLMIVTTSVGIYDYLGFAAASAFPVATVVWIFLSVQLLGGLLVLAGTLRALQSHPDGSTPEPV